MRSIYVVAIAGILALLLLPGMAAAQFDPDEERAREMFIKCLDVLGTDPCLARSFCNEAAANLPGEKALVWATEHAIEQCGEEVGEEKGPSLEKEEIKEVIQSHTEEIRYCYTKVLTVEPELEGKVVVRFEIRETGKVGTVEITESTLNHESVEGCIVAAIRKWVFPEPRNEDTVFVTYPFIFSKN